MDWEKELSAFVAFTPLGFDRALIRSPYIGAGFGLARDDKSMVRIG
jgi:hypothetical protein